jgi:hypothetical protein
LTGGAICRLTVCVICLSAVAPLEADWALAGFLGTVGTRANTLTLLQPDIGTSVSLDPVHYQSESFSSPLYYGFRLTSFLRHDFGLEGEFFHAKAYARTGAMVDGRGTVGGAPLDGSVRLDSIVERFSMSHGLNFLLANAVYRHQIGHAARPRAWLLARAGAGMTVPHVESAIHGRYQEQYERGGPACQIAVAGEWRLAGPLYAAVDYKLTTTSVSVAVTGGTVSGRFTSNHVAFGIAWHVAAGR